MSRRREPVSRMMAAAPLADTRRPVGGPTGTVFVVTVATEPRYVGRDTDRGEKTRRLKPVRVRRSRRAKGHRRRKAGGG